MGLGLGLGLGIRVRGEAWVKLQVGLRVVFYLLTEF